MNKERILNLAQVIEDHAKAKTGLFGLIGFNMAEFWAFDAAKPDHIASDSWPYDDGLVDHVDSCETVACIAGWCTFMASGEQATKAAFKADDIHGGSTDARRSLRFKGWEIDGRKYNNHDSAAQAYLGIDHNEAYELFMARGSLVLMRDITADQAVWVLRNLAATGKVDWKAATNLYRA